MTPKEFVSLFEFKTEYKIITDCFEYGADDDCVYYVEYKSFMHLWKRLPGMCLTYDTAESLIKEHKYKNKP